MNYKRLNIFIFLWLISISVFGQTEDKTKDQIAFDEIFEVYYDEEFDSTVVMFQDFIEDFPESPLIPRAKYNIGYILREIDRDDESIPYFEELLKSNYNEKEKYGGIMEQYTLYKHRSASNLAQIYLDKKDFDKASYYIKLFDKKYKYKHFCGNELMASEIYTAVTYAKLYRGQGKLDKAINKLLPYMFYNGLASNKSVLNLLNEILIQRYSNDELYKFVNEARTSLTIKDNSTAEIKFLGKKITLYAHQLFAPGTSAINYSNNLQLEGMEIWEKVFDTNDVFKNYINNKS